MVLLGLGDLGATKTPGDAVKTLALGSCVAVILLVPSTRCVGMVHVVLPESSLDVAKSRLKPGYFADTAIPALFDCVCRTGGTVSWQDVYVKLAGGANVLRGTSTLDVGRRNVLAIKKLLWQLGTGAVAEDVEGNFSRTVSVSVDSGIVALSSPSKGEWTI